MWRETIQRVGAALHEDALKAAVIAAATALAAGGATAFISGLWWRALLAAVGLALLSFIGVLLTAALRHGDELGEVGFDIALDEDARKRDSVAHERDQRTRIADATNPQIAHGRHGAEIKAMLERCRQQISRRRADSVGLLLVSDRVPHAPTVIAAAGLFDHSVLEKPQRLFHWLEDRAGRGQAHSALLPGLDDEYRLVGLAEAEDSTLGEHDRAEIEHAASHTHGLLLAHRVAGFQQRLAG